MRTLQQANRFVISGSTTYLFCPVPKIGVLLSVPIDTADLLRVITAGFWKVVNVSPNRDKAKLYVCTHLPGTQGLTYLHRFLTNCPKGKLVDHENLRGTDNRRSANLRVCTGTVNQLNRGPRSKSKSGLRGVRWDSESGKYRARVRNTHLGFFADPIEAHEVVQAHLRAIGITQDPTKTTRLGETHSSDSRNRLDGEGCRAEQCPETPRLSKAEQFPDVQTDGVTAATRLDGEGPKGKCSTASRDLFAIGITDNA